MAHEYQHINPDRFADSAGVPWDGRHFEANPWSGDDGSADPKLIAVLASFGRGEVYAEHVVAALHEVRLLVPLVANLGEAGEGANGHTVDKSADLSIVSVASPDGQVALPVFTSVAAMSAWDPKARPVPIEAPRVALAAASESNGRIVVDPGTETEFAVRKNAFRALAEGTAWVHPVRDPELRQALAAVIDIEPVIENFAIQDGDPTARLTGPEILVYLKVEAGLPEVELNALVQRVSAGWAASELVAQRIDSLGIKLVSA
jgi:hypothetical protein